MGILFRQFSTGRLAILARELSGLQRGGVHILRSLELIAERNRAMRGMLTDMADAIRQGSTLTGALRPHAHRFPRFFIEMVAVGEQSGQLASALNRLADYYDTQLAIRRAMIRGMSYPLSILLVAIYLIPIGQRLLLAVAFEQSTEGLVRFIVFHLASTTANLAFLLLIVAALSRLGILRRIRWFLAIYVPPFRGIYQRLALMRFLQSLSMMLDAGLFAGPSIHQAAAAMDLPALERDVLKAVPRAAQGCTLYDALRDSRYLPSMVLEMLNVGEQAGAMGDSVERAGKYLYDEAIHSLTVLAHCIEGITLLIVAFMLFGGHLTAVLGRLLRIPYM